MTTQIPDIVNFLGQPYEIVGVDGVGLFEPKDHGLGPSWFSTACWRGYHCECSVHDEALFLEQLNIGLIGGASAEGAQVFGRVIESYTYEVMDLKNGAWVPKRRLAAEKRVCNLHQPVRFSSRLLLGGESIPEMDEHMGFQPAHGFRTVHELTFEHGRLQKAIDRSSEMADLRRAMNCGSRQPKRSRRKRES
jgi:hypothetical protein